MQRLVWHTLCQCPTWTDRIWFWERSWFLGWHLSLCVRRNDNAKIAHFCGTKSSVCNSNALFAFALFHYLSFFGTCSCSCTCSSCSKLLQGLRSVRLHSLQLFRDFAQFAPFTHMFDSLHLLPMFALFALYCFMLLDDALWCLIKMLYLHIYLSLSRVYFTCICVYIYMLICYLL